MANLIKASDGSFLSSFTEVTFTPASESEVEGPIVSGPFGGTYTFTLEFKSVDPSLVEALYGQLTTGSDVNATRAQKLYDLIPSLRWADVDSPCSCRIDENPYRWSVKDVIIHLNDAHGKKDWDRDRIADWVDSLDLDLTIKAAADR